MIAVFLVAIAIGFAFCYWPYYLDAVGTGGPATTSAERAYACLLLWGILLVGMLLWPRRRRDIPLMDYIIPCSAFYFGALGISLLAYHYRTCILYMQEAEIPYPAGTREYQALSLLGSVAGFVYLTRRSYPPKPDTPNPHTGWRRHIQFTLLDDIVGWFTQQK